MLASRGRHLLAKAKAFAIGLGTNPTFIPVTPPFDQLLRDFYHDTYYAAFFAARYALVAEGHFDDSEHKAIPKALAALAQRFQSSDASKYTLVKFTESTIHNLRNHRNKADYVMNTVDLSLLATPATVGAAESDVTQIYSDWGIP